MRFVKYFIFIWCVVLFPAQQDYKTDRGWGIFLDTKNYIAMINGYRLNKKTKEYSEFIEIDSINERFIIKINRSANLVIVYIPKLKKKFHNLEEAFVFIKKYYGI